MRNLMNSDQSYTGLVQKYIGSAYDNVYAVSQQLEMLKRIGESLDNGDLEDLHLFITTFNEVMELLGIFNNSFYGALDVQPTTRPDGTAMVGGDVYYDNMIGGLFVYELHATGSYAWTAFDASHTYEETIAATITNQKIFNLTKFTYIPDTGNLSVYVAGLRLVPSEFTETSPTSVTLSDTVDIINVGTKVEFLYNEKNGGDGANSFDAINITFDPAPSGLTATDVQNAIDEVAIFTVGLGSFDAGTF